MTAIHPRPQWRGFLACNHVSGQDESVHLYYRRYSATPVTEKFLLVVANVEVDSPFVITAFYTNRLKSGRSLDIE